MARTPSSREQIGIYRCWSCTREIPVKRMSTGKLSASCGWCDFTHYANEGTEHYKRLLAATTLDKKPEVPAAAPPAKEPEKKPAAAPAPAAAPRRSLNPFGR